jgi:hypothetical protein
MSLAIFAAAAVIQSADPIISFEARAVPLKEALKGLSETAEQTLTCAGVYKDEPVILSIDEKPLSEVREALALTFGGKWVREGRGLSLHTDNKIDRQENATAFQQRTKDLQAARTDWLEKNEQQGWSAQAASSVVQAEYERRQKMVDQIKGNLPAGGNAVPTLTMLGGNTPSPAKTALRALVQKLSIQDLASIQPGQRVVFSDKPTLKQKSLPIGAVAIGPEFVRYHNAFAAAVAGLGGGGQIDGVNVLGSMDFSTKPVARAGKILAAVQRPATNPSALTISLKIAGPDGLIIGSADMMLLPPPEDFQKALLPKIDGLAEGVVKLTDIGQQVISALAQGGSLPSTGSSNRMVMRTGGATVRLLNTDMPEAKGVPAGLRAMMSRPDRSEPLSWYVADAMIQTAQHRGVSLCALLPDDAFVEFAERLAQGDLALSQVPAIAAKSGAHISEGQGWLLASAPQHKQARTQRVDRPALGALLGVLDRQGYVRLHKAAEYAAVAPLKPSIDKALTALFSEPLGEMIFSQDDTRQWLAFYAAMPKNGLDASEDGLTFNAAAVSGYARQAAEDVLYSRPTPLILPGQQQMAMMISMSIGGEDGPPAPAKPSIYDEPTERFPTGLPNRGQIKMSAQIDDALFARSLTSRRGKFMTAEAMGMMQGMSKNNPNMRRGGATLTRPDMRFQDAASAQISINFDFEGGGPSTTLEDGWTTGSSAVYDYAGIPAGFAKAAEEAAARMQSFNFGSPGSIRPPQ